MCAALPSDVLNTIFRFAVYAEPATYASIVLCCKPWYEASLVACSPEWDNGIAQTLRTFFVTQLPRTCSSLVARSNWSSQRIRYFWGMQMAMRTGRLKLVQFYAGLQWTCKRKRRSWLKEYGWSRVASGLIVELAAAQDSIEIMKWVWDVFSTPPQEDNDTLQLDMGNVFLENILAFKNKWLFTSVMNSPKLSFERFCPCRWMFSNVPAYVHAYAIQKRADDTDFKKHCPNSRSHDDAPGLLLKSALSREEWHVAVLCTYLPLSHNDITKAFAVIRELGPVAFGRDSDNARVVRRFVLLSDTWKDYVRGIFYEWATVLHAPATRDQDIGPHLRALETLREISNVTCNISIMMSWDKDVRKKLKVWRKQDSDEPDNADFFAPRKRARTKSP